MHQNLDEKFMMSVNNVGERLLTQKIRFEEFVAQRGTRNAAPGRALILLIIMMKMVIVIIMDR